jgi:hypothetical protein
LGDRIVRARCNVGLAPYAAAGLDFFDGMDPLNVVEFGWALDGESRLVPELERQLQEMGERMDADLTQLLSDAVLGGRSTTAWLSSNRGVSTSPRSPYP